MKTVQRTPKWSLYVVPVLLGVCIWQGWAWWSWATMPPIVPGQVSLVPGEKPIRIQISPGTPSQHIGQDLKSAGLIRSAQAWNLWARWLSLRDQQGGFQAGTYELSPTQSMQTIAAKIWAGETVQFSFTIPEGWSLRQMAAYFESQGFFKAQDFLTTAQQIPSDQFAWLPSGIPHVEGFLYPDTYQLASDRITPSEVIRKMLVRFEQLALPVYQQQRQKPSLTLLEWVTLASIVEKEAVIPTERPQIAGVFVNRLKLKMPLGADPTVEYGLNVQQTPDQPLTLAQVRTPSAYNTYLNVGLPPTPIASPGLASLEASLYPENTPYLYFVARYDGTHVFSRTLQEHEAAQAAIRDAQSTRQKANPATKPLP
ncbi:aminodeoxychorismate lyase [Leptolyngbya sp. 'hensonii']|uniref:endolytic transglycosylase MltG n=1 Tax=Leptolyngbya sp. 'hensonii' TaxID=1922337 RepID=UPI0009500FA5|nr:endolytic transglycosylase MltG [Leptolyngbya sp. 'hensonii']OLP16387.1 aminodeoxychorismate lyase [Leptolyngbya sp. 'hensonii']